ncbi:MAG: ATP-dependent zinc metalloprotease FtsH, partial [Nitrospirota bacterium]|nr:ATP-dependent zinc metalloprotease FtsH [Nitrospirota bacterium]
VEQGQVREVTIEGQNITGKMASGASFSTYSPETSNNALIGDLQRANVAIFGKPPEPPSLLGHMFVSWFPFIVLIGLWIFFMRQMQGGGGGRGAMSFGKSKARLLGEDQINISFNDVAGVDEAKEEVMEIIDFLKDPKKFQKLGGRIPKGVLIIGPPGTGKTLLAKAIAGEAGVPFFSISGSDFVEMFVGVGASRVRDLFEQGKKHAPCIIFIDEIDAVGRLRGAGLGGGHDEREQTLNQLLVEMDGFDTTEGVILIAATNRPDVLDPALMRPGRFDRQVVVNRPDVRGRAEILHVHTKKVPIASDVNLEHIARGTPGFSGADLENLVNEAALWAARLDKKSVDQIDFENAKDKVLMGVERKSMVFSEEEKRTTAFHEAGHALMAKLLPGTDPVHKVTIIPRGRAMGMTMQLPIDDRHSYSKDFLYNTLSILFGGRVAEELIFKNITTGAGNDIERATELARKMVCEWGMSEKLGPLTFGKKEEEPFLGRDFFSQRNFSDQIALEIDKEVKRLVVEAYERTKLILTEHIHTLRALAEALLEKEVLDGIEVDKIVERSLSLQPIATV